MDRSGWYRLDGLEEYMQHIASLGMAGEMKTTKDTPCMGLFSSPMPFHLLGRLEMVLVGF
jgi:hypothetical protein